MENFCLKNIYSHLEDEESRFLFEKRLCYSLTNDLSRMVYAINRYPLYNIKENLFIFGAGAAGHSIVNTFPEVCWRAFIDNDSAKVGKQDILPIISFQEFIENSKNTTVFISSPLYGDEMKRQLIDNGFSEDFIIFLGLQYFDLPYFKPQKNEFFIDAGGYDGCSTKCFFKWLLDYERDGKSIVFEPNPILYNDCKKNLKDCDNVKIVNKGLWHKKETLKFRKIGDSSCIDSDGEEIIEVINLDEYLKDERDTVTFIKMDIEGAELNALKGAEQIIKKYKPKLAICIYHKPEDVWEIPNLLLEFVPDYKFYIRHYSLYWSETVLYALH
jgi:FkbM family methyltransferase